MKTRLSKILLTTAMAAVPLTALPLVGCEDEHVVGGVAVESHDYAYVPGYYYDEGYWDTYHHWHPREFYYYDGHRWDHRDVVPHGYAMRERHADDERLSREGHFGHDEHR
jgi:hypothetical protein